MEKKTLSISLGTKGGTLDDDYTLYDDGTVLHEYDRHTYPGGYNLKESLQANELSDSIKRRLYDAASNENKQLVLTILEYNFDN